MDFTLLCSTGHPGHREVVFNIYLLMNSVFLKQRVTKKEFSRPKKN